jgi:hypothetical protein
LEHYISTLMWNVDSIGTWAFIQGHSFIRRQRAVGRTGCYVPRSNRQHTRFLDEVKILYTCLVRKLDGLRCQRPGFDSRQGEIADLSPPVATVKTRSYVFIVWCLMTISLLLLILKIMYKVYRSRIEKSIIYLWFINDAAHSSYYKTWDDRMSNK